MLAPVLGRSLSLAAEAAEEDQGMGLRLLLCLCSGQPRASSSANCFCASAGWLQTENVCVCTCVCACALWLQRLRCGFRGDPVVAQRFRNPSSIYDDLGWTSPKALPVYHSDWSRDWHVTPSLPIRMLPGEFSSES